MTNFQPLTLFGRFTLASTVMHTLRAQRRQRLGLGLNDWQYRRVPAGSFANRFFALLVGTAALSLGPGGCAKKRNESQAVPKAIRVDVAGAARRLGLVLEPENVLANIASSTPVDFQVRTAHGLGMHLRDVRLSLASDGAPRILIAQLRAVLDGSLSQLFDDWRALANGFGVPVAIASAHVEFEDRLWSRVVLGGVSLNAVSSGYAVHADELAIGPKHWNNVTFTVEKPQAAVLIHWGGREPGSRPWELRYVPTPGVASEWILDIPSQPLKALELPGSHSLPCARANGVLSFVVPENPQLKMRGRFQSVADECQAPNWPESSAFFGGTVSLAFGVEPSDDHQSWNLRSVNFTSAMFELTGAGKLVLQEEPELTWEVSGSRTCAQLEANLAPSPTLERVKAFVRAARSAQAAKRERVTLSMRGRVRANANLERMVTWRLDGNCGIADARDP